MTATTKRAADEIDARTYVEREREAREARERGEFVGFLACSHGPGRLLKVALPDERQRVSVPCPVDGCSDTHRTRDSMPRPRQRGERCDVVIEPSPRADNPTSDPGSGRRQVSDAAILAAVPEQDTPAMEIATALGYSKTQPLMKRIRVTNERAEAKGEPAPFVLTVPAVSAPGRPALVRRAG
jgi:hypothetical protein